MARRVSSLRTGMGSEMTEIRAAAAVRSTSFKETWSSAKAGGNRDDQAEFEIDMAEIGD